MKKRRKVRTSITIDEDLYEWALKLPRSMSLSSLINSMLRRRRAYEERKMKKKLEKQNG